MNEQEIKELIERLRKCGASGFLTNEEIQKSAAAIEHLQAELRAKDERIKKLEEFKQFAIDSVDTDETGLGEFGRGEESARFELYQMFTTWELGE